jgi:hypothetical protein
MQMRVSAGEEMTIDTPTAPHEFRERLISTTILRVHDELEEVIATLPPDEPEEVRDAIRQEIIPHTRHILSALSLRELTDAESLQSHIDSCLATARYFVHRIALKRSL